MAPGVVIDTIAEELVAPGALQAAQELPLLPSDAAERDEGMCGPSMARKRWTRST